MKTHKTVYQVLGAAVFLALTSAAAQAETLSQFFAASKIGGQIRSYRVMLTYGF